MLSRQKECVVPLPLDNQLCFTLYATSMAINRTYKPMLDEMGITYPQYLVLNALAEADGKTRGDGLTILRAPSAEAARKIAEADPFVVNGLRSFELREWTVMEGSLGIKVNLSDQSIELA